MSHRKTRRGLSGQGSRPPSPPSQGEAPDAPSTPISDRRSDPAPPPSADALRGAIERAADRAKAVLSSTGKINPTAIFVYANGPKDLAADNATTKVVSLLWKDEIRKEALKRKIREKAKSEGALAVVLMTEAKSKRVNDRGSIVISGVTPDKSVTASVTYTLDTETKTLSSWEMQWLDQPVGNFFLEGIFAN